REWNDLHRQLRQAAGKLGIKLSTSPAEPDQVHRALLAGLLSHVGMRDKDTREFRGARNARFQLAHGSALAKKPPAWVVAAELVETNRLWGRTAAAIDPAWAEELGAHLVKRSYGEPSWDERSGRAVTTERVTLYGLPVVTGRTVGYDRVDRHEARDLFVDHALVEGRWHGRHPFLAANRAVIEEAAALGDRIRRYDVVDQEAVFDFYDRRVGEGVVSARHFDRWWKQARRDDPDLLTMALADLVGEGTDVDPAHFPDNWRQGDLDFAVTYRFEPGEPGDGVTVHVPLAVLNRVEPEGFDWQVPGFREELAEALVRTLPKARRRHLMPLAEQAREAARRVRRAGPGPDRRLVDVLAEVLSELAGERIAPEDLDVREVPPHLRITFSVEDDGRAVAVGKDLDAVRDLVGGRVRAAIAEATPEIERTGITRWDVGDLPRVVTSDAGGQRVQGYPALLDDGDSVAIRVFSRPEVAERIMPGGVRRLVLLTVPVGVRGLERAVPGPVRLGLLAVPDLTMGTLLRDVIVAAADQVVSAHGGATWEQAGFERLLAAARAELRPAAEAALRGAGDVVVAAAAVEAALDRLVAPALQPSVDDARAQLRRLVRPGFVTASGTRRLADVVRYVRGIERRLEKVAEDPVRDQQRLREVRAVELDYQKLLAALRPSQVTPRVIEAGWMVEELRMSTFAQALGTKGQVSAKRITRELDRLFAGDLD
ncbi:MAG TPA: DUF3418 domain-containing protein, partial [Aquihabitans sp.]|nr:DUF3418 domain-containing protein [Aquihabitans sp.]